MTMAALARPGRTLAAAAVLATIFVTGAGAAGAQSAQADIPPRAGVDGPPALTAPLALGARSGADFACPHCDLTGADLSGRDLSGANLHGADLSGADLSGADLRGAMLANANLTRADLSGARLDAAPGRAPTDLAGARLDGARLAGARLGGADLQYVDLDAVDLAGADLGGGILRAPDGGLDGAPFACGGADLAHLKTRVHVAAGAPAAGGAANTCGASPETACSTIQAGLAQCRGTPDCGVLVAWGRYAPKEPIRLVPGVDLYGGCSAAGEPGLQSLVAAPAGGRPAITADGLKDAATRVHGFRLQGSDAAEKGGASVAFALADSTAVTLAASRVAAGRGGDGADGRDRDAARNGRRAPGFAAGTNPACRGADGGAGSSVMNVAIVTRDVRFACPTSCPDNACWGHSAPGGALGGQPGNATCAECFPPTPGVGHDGADGDPGRCGAPGRASADLAGSFGKGGWRPGRAGDGGAGADGVGGGGGGAGGATGIWCFWVKTLRTGNHGGGGGAGGCGAAGGTGGQMGGAAFAVTATAASLTLTDTTLVGGAGGRGGDGGRGGKGGRGGDGHPGRTSEAGAQGGHGGAGGHGGSGGGGAAGNGGPAIGIALVRGARLVDRGVRHYAGVGGHPGASGHGGGPSASGMCRGTDGGAGHPGLSADVQKF